MSDDAAVPVQFWVGVDVAAVTVTVAWTSTTATSTAAHSYPHTAQRAPAEGFAALQRDLARTQAAPAATLVVMEATGSYWIALAVTLHAAGYQVRVITPLHAHHFAKAQLCRAKTDALDAHDLARLAATLALPRWTPPPAVYHEVRQRLLARDGLMAMRQQARNQRHALSQWPVVVAAVQAQLDAVIAGGPLGSIDTRITTREEEIAMVLASSEWAPSLACLTRAPGIGVLTAAWLRVTTLNFTAAPNAEAVVAGCPLGRTGLAPMPRQSGTSLRGTARIGHGGNDHLRTAVYLATLAAARDNPQIRACYLTLLYGAERFNLSHPPIR